MSYESEVANMNESERSVYKQQREEAFIKALFENGKENNQWIRGHVIDCIVLFYPIMYDMMEFMTEEIPKRPTDEQVKELVWDNTSVSKKTIDELWQK